MKYKTTSWQTFYAVLFLFFFIPTQAFTQSLYTSSSSSSLLLDNRTGFLNAPLLLHPEEVQKKNRLSIGLYVELLSITGFVQCEITSRLKIGVGFGGGIGGINPILIAGDDFGTEKTINYSDERGQPRGIIEGNTACLFANFSLEYTDVKMGFKFSNFIYRSNFNSEGYSDGQFTGFYIQPLFGKGWFQYSFRFLIGNLSARNSRDFAVLLQPFILVFNFGKKSKKSE